MEEVHLNRAGQVWLYTHSDLTTSLFVAVDGFVSEFALDDNWRLLNLETGALNWVVSEESFAKYEARPKLYSWRRVA